MEGVVVGMLDEEHESAGARVDFDLGDSSSSCSGSCSGSCSVSASAYRRSSPPRVGDRQIETAAMTPPSALAV